MRAAILLCIGLIFFGLEGRSQPSETDANKEAEYTRTINSRAQKIVATLGIQDSVKFNRIQGIIASQYRHLNEVHTSRDESIKKFKASEGPKPAIDSAVNNIQTVSGKRIDAIHRSYLTQLATELSPEQVDKVKDGMTYNVVNVTYSGYLDMLQNLSDAQKSQIMTWLVEAREHAMDAESSEKKHEWFGKYKGRINNYLSAAGYDLKKETEAWQQRIKERAQKKNTSTN